MLLTAAKLTQCKGHDYLLEALPQVLAHHPAAISVLAGDGELLDTLRTQATRLGIADRVWFVGHRQDVPDLIAAADLVVLPSHTEGLCSTLIEAMHGGRPIVTTTAGGIPELMGDDETAARCAAWLVPPRDAHALAEAILLALSSPERCDALRQQALRRAQQRFTADRMVEATLAVYGEVLEPAGAVARENGR